MGRFEAFFAVLILALMLTLMVTGCSDNTCKPKVCGPKPTIENIWPNDDQRFWEYEYTQRTWGGGLCDTFYETEEELPPAPTLDEIEDLFNNHPIGDDPQSRFGVYKMIFDGDTTTEPGVTAQALEDTAYFDGVALAQDEASGWRRLVLGQGSTMNPDLGGMILQSHDSVEQFVSYPLMIHGGAWEKTDAYIGTYGHFDTLLAWKFLEADLSPGSEFTFPILSSIAGDSFLHCRILRRANITLGDIIYPNAIECLYLADYMLYFNSEFGYLNGWCRLYDYGTVIYAPTVGPVYSYERALVEAGNDESTGVGDKTLVLTDTGVTPSTRLRENRGSSWISVREVGSP